MTAPTSPPEVTNQLRLSPRAFERFAALITRELGIKMSQDKIPMLQGRLLRRLRALHLQSLEEYQECLFSPDGPTEELTEFIDAVTTNKTEFFRENPHFRYLTETALPQLDPDARRLAPPANPGPWTLNLWCAGCSSGEEPYTLAMVLSEFATQRQGFDFSILGTDVSSTVLQHAAQAIYSGDRIHPIGLDLRRKYLLRRRDPSRDEFRIVPELRSRVRFERLNFMDASYPIRERFEIIFFRNVMIYFARATQEAVINKLCRHLVPGGYLFVGHSESLTGLHLPVHPVAPAVYRLPS